MRKFYPNEFLKDGKSREPGPKKETIQFLLDYSKALKVLNSRKQLKFEMLLN